MNTPIKLNPEFLTKNGKPEYAVIAYDEFAALQEYLEDMEDLFDLREARAEDDGERSCSIEDVRQELGI